MKNVRLPGISWLFALCACGSTTVNLPAGPGGDAGPGDPTMGLDGGKVDGSKPLDGGTEDAAPPDALKGCTLDPGAPTVAVDGGAPSDPIGAENFTLAQALMGFPSGAGDLKAAITTEKSTILCTLDEAKAPISVANFVGLARGTRPYLDTSTNQWTTGHFYDGLIWHRVIPGFVIQGGDPLGDGTGGPGYDLPQENHGPETLGALAMAASSAPSGSQFYIVVGKGPAADYNVFGHCATEVAVDIANVPRDANDKPKTPVHMQKVVIARCP